MTVDSFNRLAELASRAARNADLDGLLAALHRAALDAAGGTVSLLLVPVPGLGAYLAAPGIPPGVSSHLQVDEPAAIELLDGAFEQARPVVATDPALPIPGLPMPARAAATVLVPLAHGSERLGVLAIGAARAPLAPHAAAMLTAIGHLFALALARARLEEDAGLQRQVRDILLTFSRSVSSTLTFTPALELLCAQSAALFCAQRASVWLHDRRARMLTLEASSDPAWRARGGSISIAAADRPVARAMRWERAGILPSGDPRAPDLLVPLRGRNRALGTLVLEALTQQALGRATTLDCADDLGRRLSFTIENLQLLEAVLRSRRDLENTFNSIADLVVVCDRRLRVKDANQAFAGRAGTTRAALLDRQLADFVGPETSAWIAGLPLAAMSDRAPLTREIADPVLNGTFSITVTALMNPEGEPAGIVAVARDITRQVRLEAEREALRARLTQSEKLAALGQFVAGIAHELNNPLQGVLGRAELMLVSEAQPAGLRRDLRRIQRDSERAARIVRNLLVFAGSRPTPHRRVSLNAILTRTLALRSTACRAAGIEIVRALERHLPRLKADPLLLQQAFLNLLLNAEQAIAALGKRGRIEVRTSRSPDGRGLIAQIRDTGAGITPEVLPRIFEPFYTTKDVGGGTGLGLAIAYGIIQDHRGEISVGNHEAGGAVFTIELPAAEGARVGASPARPS